MLPKSCTYPCCEGPKSLALYGKPAARYNSLADLQGTYQDWCVKTILYHIEVCKLAYSLPRKDQKSKCSYGLPPDLPATWEAWFGGLDHATLSAEPADAVAGLLTAPASLPSKSWASLLRQAYFRTATGQNGFSSAAALQKCRSLALKCPTTFTRSR